MKLFNIILILLLVNLQLHASLDQKEKIQGQLIYRSGVSSSSLASSAAGSAKSGSSSDDQIQFLVDREKKQEDEIKAITEVVNIHHRKLIEQMRIMQEQEKRVSEKISRDDSVRLFKKQEEVLVELQKTREMYFFLEGRVELLELKRERDSDRQGLRGSRPFADERIFQELQELKEKVVDLELKLAVFEEKAEQKREGPPDLVLTARPSAKNSK